MAGEIEVRVPDIGEFEQVEVVEILVAKGDRVAIEDSLVSIESDKATMEIPSPAAGLVQELHVALGDLVSEGSLLLVLLCDQATDAVSTAAEQAAKSGGETPPAPDPPAPAPREQIAPAQPAEADAGEGALLPGAPPHSEPPVRDEPMRAARIGHASPLVRRFARELGVDLARTTGTGPHGRVMNEDVKGYVSESLAGQGGGLSGLPPIPSVDFARFGPVEEQEQSRIRRAAATQLTRSWLNLPHVTQHDEADVTEIEAFRRRSGELSSLAGRRLSPLHFVMKAVAVALREFPRLRSSLSADGERLIVKQYCHLGIAVDTEHGLVVPVVRDVDQKGLGQLSDELSELAGRARARKLSPSDMQGACFSISSLGGIGGSAFTPIVNAPEVAILGLSKLRVQPVWSAGLDLAEEAGGAFRPRLMLPLSLSYDHRVIDGAEGARFTSRLAQILSHPANLLL